MAIAVGGKRKDLKPENIDRALAGVGSTRPEELRERLLKLTIERDGLQPQLELLGNNVGRCVINRCSAEGKLFHLFH